MERNASASIEPKCFIGINLNNIVYYVLTQENEQSKKVKTSKVLCNNTKGITLISKALRLLQERVVLRRRRSHVQLLLVGKLL